MWIKSNGLTVLILIALHMLLHHVVADSRTTATIMQIIISLMTMGGKEVVRAGASTVKQWVSKWAIQQVLTGVTLLGAVMDMANPRTDKHHKYVPKSQRKKCNPACRIVQSAVSRVARASWQWGNQITANVRAWPAAQWIGTAWRATWTTKARGRRAAHRRWSRCRIKVKVRLTYRTSQGTTGAE